MDERGWVLGAGKRLGAGVGRTGDEVQLGSRQDALVSVRFKTSEAIKPARSPSYLATSKRQLQLFTARCSFVANFFRFPTRPVMSFPSQREVDALTSFEDDEFDALLSGASSKPKLTPSKSPASSSPSVAQSNAPSSSSSRVRSSTVAVSDPSQQPPSNAKTSTAAAPPMTFGSTAFLSELQNRRKHVLQDNSLKAGASDDDCDPQPAAAVTRAAAPKHATPPIGVPGPKVDGEQTETQAAKPPTSAQDAVTGAAVQCDKAAPDASACLRRLDRLPSTVETSLKE